MKISRYWKSVAAGIAAGAGSLTTALQDDRLTAGEGITAVLVVLGALGITYWVPNREPKDGGLDEALQRTAGK
ncbi:hypothetical protein [Streptomyces sp. 049-1]|uniref:hypothetical protein n=1 Tax=Streptomyces sp. 049-1 TaxID=2789264 RepID=UPI0039805F48